MARKQWMSWLVGLSVAACGAAVGAQDLVRFKSGESITEADLSTYLEKRIDLRGSVRNVWGVETVLREMALTRALVLEGPSSGEPYTQGGTPARFDDKYALSVYRKLSPACEPPGDATAARKFFDDNPQAFRVPAMARLSRVMLPTHAELDGQPAGMWLMQQVQGIGAGSSTFDGITKRAEESHKLDLQGDLGWVNLVEENTILRALAGAKAGEIVGPVREGEFVYLFSVQGKRESRQLAWDEVAASAPARAVSYCRQTGAEKLKTGLFEKYGVQLDAAAIKALFDKSSSK